MPFMSPPQLFSYPRAIGLLLMALAGGAALLARDLPVVQRGLVGAGAFPLLLASALAVCGLALLLKSPAPTEPPPHAARAWRLLAAVMLFPLLLAPLGSLLSTAVCGTAVARITTRCWRRALAIGLCLAAGLHALVIWGLGIPLPWQIP